MTSDLAPTIVQNEAVTLARALRARTLSAVEVMNAFLDQIERLNPLVNAIVAPRPRDELLRERPRAIAPYRRASRSPAAWPAWAVKDLEDTKGFASTYGSPLFRDHVPDADGLMPSRLRRAGAIFIGKTNVPEFGFGSQTYKYGLRRDGQCLGIPRRRRADRAAAPAPRWRLNMLPAATAAT